MTLPKISRPHLFHAPSGRRAFAVVLASAMLSLVTPIALRGQVQNQTPVTVSVQGLSPEAIDSLIASAHADEPASVTIANREVVVLRAAVLGRTPADRASAVRTLVEGLSAEGDHLDVTSRPVSTASVISVGGRDVFAIVPADTDALLGQTVASTTADAVARLQQAVDEMAEAHRPRVLLRALVLSVFATAILIGALWALDRARRRAMRSLEQTTERKLSRWLTNASRVHNTRLVHGLRPLFGIPWAVVSLSLVYIWLLFVLRRFPYTRPWGDHLRAFLLDRAWWIGSGIVGIMPNLFTILLIALLTRLAIGLVHRLFAAAEAGLITIPGIHPETVTPTRRLITALISLFGLVIAYPYLPGSSTDAFKGISVLVGLMISLGSSGVVNQIMSGFTVVYARALRTGDFVRVGDIQGTVTHIGALSTKIDTPFREEVTIPNAVLVSQTTVNYSRHAQVEGVLVPTQVTIGYDAPWRQVEAMLLEAASRTAGVRTNPAPIVRQSALEDFYVRYTLLVCLEEPLKRFAVLDRLHANIQDAFNEHGVQIMSPNYVADPRAPKVVPKDQWFAPPAEGSANLKDKP